jgi:hypothetical protein
MKKIALSFAAFLLILTQGFAQDKRAFFGVSLGPSFAISDFGSKNPKDDPGWAETGLTIDLSFTYKFKGSIFGIAAMSRSQNNSIDEQAIADDMSKRYSDVSFTANSESWESKATLIGFIIELPISKRVNIASKVLFGYVNTLAPELHISGSSRGGSAWTKQEKSYANSYSFLVGTAFKIDMGSHVCFLTNVDYMGFETKFENVLITNSYNEISILDFEQKIRTINITAGLAINF